MGLLEGSSRTVGSVDDDDDDGDDEGSSVVGEYLYLSSSTHSPSTMVIGSLHMTCLTTLRALSVKITLPYLLL